ncbi:uncharacterized protein [Misgurnus anguillicaudatus]|uniref:uncharacterized protein isoform X2 n=1 Tax=Misgurnus anguillicaudatus TaxID=75329 RepID=UPI003CCF7491
MHHSDSTGESTGSRRMSHPSVFTGRRGSGAAVQPDEHQTSAMMTQTGSSSPGPHHPPHSLSIHPQAQSVGAQVKKKSGFQITSVLPAQVSASANNSIADDTESYDDMDESHTEDLSSSDILDVSVSRATDTGVPERSSSEETLNSLHGGETPGVVSPNEPVMHHAQQGYMMNGVHNHAHHHHSHQPPGHPKPAQGRPAVSPVATVGPATQGKFTSGRSVQAAVVEGGGPAAMSQPAASTPVAGALTGGVAGAAQDGGGPTGAAGSASVAPVQPTPPTQTTVASTASRFRVVKLDSNSEPFRKGRWSCTEYYEKDAPHGDTAAAHRTVENILNSEHESTSSSSSGSTLSGGGGGDVPTPSQLHAHPQDPGALSVLQPSINPQAVPVTGMLSTDSLSAPVRPVSYSVEISQVQSTYPTKPPVSVSQPGITHMEYGQISSGVQPGSQPLQVPPIQGAVSPRAAPLTIGMPGLPTAVSQPVSPRPQVSAPQMGAQLHPDQQQTGTQLSSSTGSSVPPQSNLQPALQSHGAALQGLPGGPGQQGGRLPPAGASYSVMSGVTASQLEDAQRLLLQHHPLLSLPRLTAGALAGPTAADAGAALGQDAVFAVATGADEDRICVRTWFSFF